MSDSCIFFWMLNTRRLDLAVMPDPNMVARPKMLLLAWLSNSSCLGLTWLSDSMRLGLEWVIDPKYLLSGMVVGPKHGPNIVATHIHKNHSFLLSISIFSEEIIYKIAQI